MPKPRSVVTRRPARTAKKNVRNNDFTPSIPAGLLNGVFDGGNYGPSPIGQPFELGAASAYNLITLNRPLLTYAYNTFGVLQTAIDQPVEDAFRGGLDIFCDEIDGDEIEKFKKVLELCKDISHLKDAMRWAKLYGGGGLIINTDQDPATPLNTAGITEDTPLAFISADRWELIYTYAVVSELAECPYNYYGQPIHHSRVIRLIGKEPPSFLKPRLQGWGMSEVERMIRDMNSYSKNQEVIYELLDEAKIDVWRIEGFNTQSLNQAARGKLSERMQIAQMMKNYHDAIVMDKEDEYEQKQLTFAGLADMLTQIRIGAAAAVRMPMTKLFGLSASGFNAGEDDIENYNALVESEVRAKAREALEVILRIRFRQVFGFDSDSLRFEFKKLRIIGAAEEANIKTQLYNRYDRMYSQGMLEGWEYAQILEQENLVPIKTLVGKKVREPEVPESSGDFEKPERAITQKVPVKGR